MVNLIGSKLSKIEKSEMEYFNKLAGRYDDNYHYHEPFTKYKIDKKAQELFNHIKPKVGGHRLKMLEVGCGTGEYTKRIAKLFPSAKIVGLDISKNIISVAKRKCNNVNNISFVVESAYATSFPKESFDVVFGYYVLHHLSPRKLVKEIHRVLKPGGLAFFYEPNILNPAVYLIKSNKYLKQKAGDSPHESAINPLKIKSYFSKFNIINVSTSEFILPLNFLSLKLLVKLDKFTSLFKSLPIINMLGGSVQIFVQKE